MLQAMRGGAKSPIMKAFLVFLAAGFALWGVGDVTTGLIGGSDKAISAGDESLSPAEVAIEFDRARRSYLPNATLGEALETSLLSEIAGNLANETLFRAEASALGLAVTRDMQRKAVANENAFRDELGEFSRTRFLSALAQAGLTEEQYLARIDTGLRRQQIVDAISGGIKQPDSAAKALTAFELERRTAQMVSVAVDSDTIGDPTDDVLSSWFEEQKSGYAAPALRSATVGMIAPEMFAAEVEVTDRDIENAYADRLDEFTTPERRSVRQMVFEDLETAETAFARLTDGEEFAAVAADLLEWTESDTTLGLVSRSDLDGAVGEAVFSTDAGGLAGPVESVFGVHILAVDDVVAGGETSLADVRDDIIAGIQIDAATDMIYDKVNVLEDRIASGATIAEAFNEVGGKLVSLQDIDRRGNDIDGAPVNSDASDSLVLDAIWDSEVDELSVIREGSDDMFFIVEVTDEKEPRDRALDEVKMRVIADWKTAQAIEAARQEAQSIADAENSFVGIDPTTDFRRNGTGLDHEAARLIAAAVFGQDIGDAGVVETGTEAIAVRTASILPVGEDELAETSALISGVIQNSIRQDVLNTLARDLSQTHDLQVRLGAVQQVLVGSQ